MRAGQFLTVQQDRKLCLLTCCGLFYTKLSQVDCEITSRVLLLQGRLVSDFFSPLSIVWFRKNLFWFGLHAQVSPHPLNRLPDTFNCSILALQPSQVRNPWTKNCLPWSRRWDSKCDAPPKPPSSDSGQVAKQVAKLAERKCAGGGWNFLKIHIKLLSHENQCNKETQCAWFGGGAISTEVPPVTIYSNNKWKKPQP